MSEYRNHRLLSAIAHNVGDPQPPLVDSTALWTTLVAHGPLSSKEALEMMDRAVEAGHVRRWTDGTGTVRYGLTADGLELADASGDLYGPADADAFRQYIETELSREEPDSEFVGWCNRQVETAKGRL